MISLERAKKAIIETFLIVFGGGAVIWIVLMYVAWENPISHLGLIGNPILHILVLILFVFSYFGTDQKLGRKE